MDPAPRRSVIAAFVVLAVLAPSCGGGEAADPTTQGTDAPASPVSDGCSGVDFRARVGVYADAQAGTIDPAVPANLGPAVNAVPAGLFTGVLYGGCASESANGLGYEQMMWTNGIGVLSVSWQEWPDDGPLAALPFGGQSRQAGIVQVAATDVEGRERTRMVHLYDGMRVLTVATYSLTTLSIEQAEEIAWAVYDALPVRTSGRVIEASRTFEELFEALPSDTLSVSGLEDVEEMSPFTAAVAIPAVTRRFLVGGSVVTAFDFGALGSADRAAGSISSDGFTIARMPYDAGVSPRYWRWDRVILQYMGTDRELLERLVVVLGQPFAGETIPVGNT